jgi:hypothetical protein
LERKTGQAPAGTAVVEVAPSLDRHGQRLSSKFDAFLGEQRIAMATETPFCCSARALVKRGHAADTILIMRHRGFGTESLKALINVAARLTVREDRCGPRFSSWKALCLRAVGAPIAQQATTDVHHHRPTFNSMED